MEIRHHARIINLLGVKLGRILLAITVTIGIFGSALAAAHALRFFHADPTVSEYVAHVGEGAQVVPSGQLHLDGITFTCGQRPTVLNARLDDYAAAYYGFLIINTERFTRLPPILKRYAYTHECGHQYMGRNELAADCYAIKRGRREGWLNEGGLERICQFIGQSKGDAAHPAGTKRCQHMRRCFAQTSRLPSGL